MNGERPAVVGSARDAILVVGGQTLAPGMTQRLMAAGFAIEPVRTGDEALEVVSDRIPAAVFLSPSRGEEPYGLVRRLRSQERLAFMPVFVFAFEAQQRRMVDAIAAGADDVFDQFDEAPDPAIDAAERILARIARSRSLAQLALLDPLTGLHNRRFMNDRLAAEVARARRACTTLSVSLIDLDDFKSINHAFGHLAGDRALAAFAQALRTGVRNYDIIRRFGGDEFVLLLPDCRASGACTAFEQLRARRAWALPDLPVVTFSAGVAQFPDDGGSWTDLFDVADRNVRRAKQAGGNCTTAPESSRTLG